MTSTYHVNPLSSSAAIGCASTITVMVLTQDASSEQVGQALLDRTSRLLAHPLPVVLSTRDPSSLPLERSLINVLQGDEGEKCLVLPWLVTRSAQNLIETAKHALALMTHETIDERNPLLHRRSASGLASFGSWDGIRNPEEALDRLIAISPGWHRQATWLRAGTRSVLLPCIEQTVPPPSITTQQQLASLRQAVEGVLLHNSSLTVSLRRDGEKTVSYLVRWVADLVMLLASPNFVGS